MLVCVAVGVRASVAHSFRHPASTKAELETLQIANRQEQGWIATAKSHIELTHDMAKGARTVAASSRDTLVGSGSDVGFRGRVGSRSHGSTMGTIAMLVVVPS